jgi:signal peptidase I
VNVGSALRWGGQVLTWMVILFVSGVVTIAVLVPRLTGATPYVVLTGSMQPQMPPGTLVVVKPVEADEITTGTVLTYQLESGKPTVVTHRVTSVGVNGKGELRFGTKGDANKDPDARQVVPEQIKGERWYYVPYLGYVTSVITGEQRQMGLVLVVVGLLAYSGVTFVSAARDRRRRKEAWNG